MQVSHLDWITRNHLLDEIKLNNLMSKKYEKACKYLICIEHLLVLVSTITGRVSISSFTSLAAILVGIKSSAIGAITA